MLHVIRAMARRFLFGPPWLQPHRANPVTFRREFELYDLRAHLGKQSGTCWPRNELCEVQYAVSLEHPRRIHHAISTGSAIRLAKISTQATASTPRRPDPFGATRCNSSFKILAA